MALTQLLLPKVTIIKIWGMSFTCVTKIMQMKKIIYKGKRFQEPVILPAFRAPII